MAQAIGDHTTNSSLSSVVSVGIPDYATGIQMQAFDQNIQYTVDGTDPTAAKGFTVYAGDPPLVQPVNPGGTVKLLEAAATARLEYQFVRDL